ncbi:rhodanese-like domain-containing protein [Cellulophaga baltica]|uniref:rhodanese-like domain-containing protein n=1 Tax=Cellulophaga TaxID=104264 RepID=UPI001C0794E6|nr:MULTISPECIES: rhodanese-like domain-containing protein [Cellulophaga]MBU2995477.1 rhodanese-like domain-containing protein [Cellulophaga baltica]MDO6766871.1 rhodanese-like domain-containing protein [Cellulophaga sp. 1_MG-2023]
MFKKTLLLLYFFSSCSFLIAQKSIDKALEKFNDNSIPYITTKKLQETKNVIVLDTREKEEFNVSHLKDAIWVGYKSFDINNIQVEKNANVVVYCSIGVRSEDIGEQLTKNGFTNVQNLYGGIFKWIENDFPIYDTKNNETKKVHAYDKEWGKLLKKGKKVYE